MTEHKKPFGDSKQDRSLFFLELTVFINTEPRESPQITLRPRQRSVQTRNMYTQCQQTEIKEHRNCIPHKIGQWSSTRSAVRMLHAVIPSRCLHTASVLQHQLNASLQCLPFFHTRSNRRNIAMVLFWVSSPIQNYRKDGWLFRLTALSTQFYT